MLLGVNEKRNILHEIRKRKANWIDHILRRNCLLKQFIEGKIKGEMEVTRKLGRFGQQIKNTWKVLKYGAGERWKRSFGPIM